MLKLLRKLVGRGGSAGNGNGRLRRPSPATSEILAKRISPSDSGTPPPRADFDPYNTGTFDRSASWERVSKRGY